MVWMLWSHEQQRHYKFSLTLLFIFRGRRRWLSPDTGLAQRSIRTRPLCLHRVRLLHSSLACPTCINWLTESYVIWKSPLSVWNLFENFKLSLGTRRLPMKMCIKNFNKNYVYAKLLRYPYYRKKHCSNTRCHYSAANEYRFEQETPNNGTLFKPTQTPFLRTQQR